MPAPFNLLPANAVKFRENSADSVVFNLTGHTAEKPRTMTVTRTLPTPRKGNAGTMKIMINTRLTSTITTPEGDRNVPIIFKVETSLPVGADILSLTWCFDQVQRITGFSSDTTDQAALFSLGLLLDNTGDNGAIT